MLLNGKNYVRVSDVIRPFIDFGHIPKEVLERKAKLGTRVHDAIHEDIEGNFPVMSANENGYLESFHKWRSSLSPTFLESEVRYCCDKKMVTGCIDTLIKLEREEEAILVDFKTSVQESPIAWPMQAHLYHYLISSTGKKISSRFLFVKLDRFGDYPKVFKYKFDANLMNRCYQAIDDFWKSENASMIGKM